MRETEQVMGPTERRGEARMMGKRALASVLRSPQFKDVEGFHRLADSFPLAEKRKVSVESVVTRGGWFQPSNFMAVATKGEDEVHAFVGPKYHVVQHREALLPVIEGLRDLGIEFVGGSYQYNKRREVGEEVAELSATRMNVAVLLKGDQFQGEIAGRYRLGIGLVVRNSLDGSTGISVQGYGVNGWCENSIIADKLLGRVSIRHFKGTVERDMHKLETFVTELSERLGGLKRKLGELDEIPVARTQVLPLVRGTGIGQRAGLEIEEGILDQRLLVGPQKEGPLTVGRVYDGITRYYSVVYDRSLRTAEDGVRNGGKLLVRPWKEVLAVGKAKIDAEVEKALKRQEQRELAKAVAR